MFASNPSVSALEHPVYDIWVKGVSGTKVEGDLPQTEALDEETSEKIDDLIDQLMTPDASDMSGALETEIPNDGDAIEDEKAYGVTSIEALISKEPGSLLSHGHAQGTIDIELKNLEEKINTLNVSPEELTILHDLFDKMKTSPIGLKLIQHRGLNAHMTQYTVWYDQLIKPTRHYPDGTPLTDFDQYFYEKMPIAKATQERGRIFKNLLPKVIPQNSTVASCPCGLMDDLLRLDQRAFSQVEFVGIDLDQSALNQAKENAEKLITLTPYRFEQKDAWALNSPERFDILTSNGLNIYVPEEEKVQKLYESFYESLKSGGILIISALTPPPALDPHCEWDFTKIDPEALLTQKRILNDILGIKWLNFRRSDVTVSQLKTAGFKTVEIYWDNAKMFPTFLCQK